MSAYMTLQSWLIVRLGRFASSRLTAGESNTRAFRSKCIKYFSYLLTKSYVVDTHKNRLNEMVLLST